MNATLADPNDPCCLGLGSGAAVDAAPEEYAKASSPMRRSSDCKHRESGATFTTVASSLHESDLETSFSSHADKPSSSREASEFSDSKEFSEAQECSERTAIDDTDNDDDTGMAASSMSPRRHGGEGAGTTRAGIMVARSHRESVSEVIYERLLAASRKRRAERIGKRGMANLEDLAVRFKDLTVRNYPIILGDNPGGMRGPPLSIDWEYSDSGDDAGTLAVDEYERARESRRSHLQMIIPSSARIEMLRRLGYSRHEILAGTRSVNYVRTQRKRAVEAHKFQPVSELVERLSRRAIDVVTLGTRKRSERRLLEPYVMNELAKDEENESVSTPSSPSTVSVTQEIEERTEEVDV